MPNLHFPNLRGNFPPVFTSESFPCDTFLSSKQNEIS